MLPKIAWRNIWRSKVRSFVVIGAVFLGVWAFISMMAITFSVSLGYVDDAIRFQTSHLQIHHPNFGDDKASEFTIDQKLYDQLKETNNTIGITQRTIVTGMVRSSRGARGIIIKGVDPDTETIVSDIHKSLLEGSFLTGTKKNEVVISQEIADKLKLKLRKKLVLQFQDINREIVSASFRVVGIFKTGNNITDLSMLMVNRKDINRLLGQPTAIHEVALLLEDPTTQLLPTQEKLSTAHPNILVENYREISPEVQLYESQIYISVSILMFIFMLALIFGIINTMLMAVLERSRELGMLMAIGMNKIRVFGMIVLETIMLGTIGAPLGMAAGWLTVKYLNKRGLDFSEYSEGTDAFGIKSFLRPELDADIYFILMIAVFVTALLASIYPALRAIKLRPIEAIRKI